ncbi:MAG: hypothetical protein R3B93_18550 [Bacteroidia bacterium]
MHTCRHLVAIMFTDIVGYTAIMQSDIFKALEIKEVATSRIFEEFHQSTTEPFSNTTEMEHQYI